MTVASFVAAQRTEHDVPHAVSCRALDLSESWLYQWLDRGPSRRELRRRVPLGRAASALGPAGLAWTPQGNERTACFRGLRGFEWVEVRTMSRDHHCEVTAGGTRR